MKRNIAVLTHEVEKPHLAYLDGGLERYAGYMGSHGFELGFGAPRELGDFNKSDGSDGVPVLRADGSFDASDLNRLAADAKIKLIHSRERASDLLLVVDRKIIEDKPRHWHTRSRGGEAYGGGCELLTPDQPEGTYCFIGLNPLNALGSELDRQRYIDYIVRHELGHVFGGFVDLPEDSEDNAMKPIVKATASHLGKKNVDYTPEQIKRIRENLRQINLATIRKDRERRRKTPIRQIVISM